MFSMCISLCLRHSSRVLQSLKSWLAHAFCCVVYVIVHVESTLRDDEDVYNSKLRSQTEGWSTLAAVASKPLKQKRERLQFH